MLTILIHGPRASGKTWATLAIQKILTEHGASVVLENEKSNPKTLRMRQELLNDKSFKPLSLIDARIRQFDDSRFNFGPIDTGRLLSSGPSKEMLASKIPTLKDDDSISEMERQRLLYAARYAPSPHFDAWAAVVSVLFEVAPEWSRDISMTTIENAVEAIRKLAKT